MKMLRREDFTGDPFAGFLYEEVIRFENQKSCMQVATEIQDPVYDRVWRNVWIEVFNCNPYSRGGPPMGRPDGIIYRELLKDKS